MLGCSQSDTWDLSYFAGTPSATWREIVTGLVSLAFHVATPPSAQSQFLDSASTLLGFVSSTSPSECVSGWTKTEDTLEVSEDGAVAEYHPAAPAGLLVRWRPLFAAVAAARLGPLAQHAAGEVTTAGASSSLVSFVRAARPFFVPGTAEAVAAAFDADLSTWGERSDEALTLMAIFTPPQQVSAKTLDRWATCWGYQPAADAMNHAWATLIHNALKTERLAALLAVKHADQRGDAVAAEAAVAACSALQLSRANLAARLLPMALSRFQASLGLRVAGSSEHAGKPCAAVQRTAAGTAFANPKGTPALAKLLIELLPAAAADSNLHAALGDSWSDADGAVSTTDDAAAGDDVDSGAADEAEFDRVAGAATSGATLRGLARILRATLRFAHPSNAGDWSPTVAQAVESLARLLCQDCTETAAALPKRALDWANGRLCASRAEVDAMTDLLLPVCKRLLFNRHPGAAKLAMSAVDGLATIRPRRIARFVGAIALDALASGSSVSKSKPIVAQNLIQHCTESLAWPRPHLNSVVLPVIHALPSLMRTAEPIWCVSAAMLAVSLASSLRLGPPSAEESGEWPDAEWVRAGADGPWESPSLMEAWDLDRPATVATDAPLRHLGLSTHPLFGEPETAAELAPLLGLRGDARSSSSSSAASLAAADAREAEEAAQASLLVWASETLAAARKVVENAESGYHKSEAFGIVSWVLDSLEQVAGTAGLVAKIGVAGLSLAESASCTAVALFAALPDDSAAAEAEEMVSWALSSAPLENSTSAARLLGCALHRTPSLLDGVIKRLLPGLLLGLGYDEAVANNCSGWAADALAGSPLALLLRTDSEAASLSHRAGELLMWRGMLLCGAVTRMGDKLLPYMGGIAAAGARMASSDGGGESVRELGRALVASVFKATASTYVLPVKQGNRSSMVRAVGISQAVEFHIPSDAEVDAVCAVSQVLAGPAMLGAMASPTSAAQLQTAENAAKLMSAMLRAAAPLLADSEAAPIASTARAIGAAAFFGPPAVEALLRHCTACGLAPVAGGELTARHLIVSSVAALVAALGQATHSDALSSAASDAAASGSQPHLSSSFVGAALALASDAIHSRGRRSVTAQTMRTIARHTCERHGSTSVAIIRAVAGWPAAADGVLPGALVVSMHPAAAEFTAELDLARRDSFLVRNWARSMRDAAQAALDCDGSADLPPDSDGPSTEAAAGAGTWPLPAGLERGNGSPAAWVSTGRGPGDGVGELERPARAILAGILALAASPVRIIAGTAAQYVELVLKSQPWQRVPLARRALEFLRTSPTLCADPKAATDAERRRALGGLRCATAVLGRVTGRRAARLPDVRFGVSKWLADGGSRNAIELAPAGHTAEATSLVVPVLEAALAAKEPIAARSALNAVAALAARADAVTSLATVVAGSASTWADRVFAIGLLCSALPVDLQHSFLESGPGDAGLVARVRGGSEGATKLASAPQPDRRLRQASSELTAGEVSEAVAALAAAALDSGAALPVRAAALTALASFFYAASGMAAGPPSSSSSSDAAPAASAPAWGVPLRQAAAGLFSGSGSASSASAASSPQAAAILAVFTGDGKDARSPLQRIASAMREDHDEATTGADGRPKASGSGRGTAAEVWSAGVGQSVGAARLVRVQTGLGTGAPAAHATLVESLIECAAVAVSRGEVVWAPADASSAAASVGDSTSAATAAATAFLEQSATLAATAKATGGADQAGVEERRSSARACTEIWAGCTSALLRRVRPMSASAGPLAESVADILAALAVDTTSGPGSALSDALSSLLSAMAWWPMEWVDVDWGAAFRYAVDSLPASQRLPPLLCVTAAMAAEAAEAGRRAETVVSEAGANTSISSLARAQRLASMVSSWQQFLGYTCLQDGTLAESAAANTSNQAGMAPPPGSEEDGAAQLAAARTGHGVAVASLLPAAAALSGHPSEPVRSFAGRLIAAIAMLGAVAGPGESASSSSAAAASSATSEDEERAGAAVPAAVSVIRALLPTSQEAADAAAALPLSDARSSLHNGRVETVASALLQCALGSSVAGTQVVLQLTPSLLSLGRLAAGDDAAQAKVMQVLSVVQTIRFAFPAVRDAAAIVAAADRAVEEAGGDSWATVRATAESGKPAARRLAALWMEAARLDNVAAAAARWVAALAEVKQWRRRAAVLVLASATFVHHQAVWPAAALDALQREVRRRMTDSRLEVRAAACSAWGGCLPAMPAPARACVAASWLRIAKRALPPNPRAAAARSDAEGGVDSAAAAKFDAALKQRHGLTLGAGAVLRSFPYTMPAFLPELAVALAEMAAFPPPVRDGAREALAEFRRTHGDTWEADRLRFTRDQLDAVGSLGSTSAMYA